MFFLCTIRNSINEYILQSLLFIIIYVYYYKIPYRSLERILTLKTTFLTNTDKTHPLWTSCLLNNFWYLTLLQTSPWLLYLGTYPAIDSFERREKQLFHWILHQNKSRQIKTRAVLQNNVCLFASIYLKKTNRMHKQLLNFAWLSSSKFSMKTWMKTKNNNISLDAFISLSMNLCIDCFKIVVWRNIIFTTNWILFCSFMKLNALEVDQKRHISFYKKQWKLTC